MSPNAASNAASAAKRRGLARVVTLAGSAFAVLGGGLTLIGWASHSARLMDWGGHGITMKANSAVCAATMGVALGLSALGRRGWLVRVLGGVVGGIAFLTLVEHATRANLGLDTLLFDEPAGSPATDAPGRMGLPASLSFLALAATVLLGTLGARARRWAAALALLPVLLVLFSLVGYLYGAGELYSVAGLTGIALQTASMIGALGIGAIASLPEHGLARALERDDPGGVALRRSIAGVVLLPVAVGWLRLRGQQAGFYDAAFGTAARTLVEIIVLVGLLWWTANGISRQAATARERRRLLDTVTAEARVGLVLLDENRRYLFANAMYAEVLGLPDAEIAGKRVADVLGPLYEQVGPRLDRAFQGERVRYELLQRSHPKTGREHVYEVSYEPRAVGGRIEQVVVVLVDISAPKAAEAALREADRRKDEFLAMLAHELRNPLAPLRTGVEVARHAGHDPATLARLHTMMDRQLTHMVRLVDDLLDVSRVSRGKIELQRTRLALGTVLESAIETARPVIEAAGHVLVVEAPEALFVDGDLTRLAQVFANLLNNAARYTPRGGRIGVTVERQGGEAVVRVRDDGVGIPPELLPQIFDTFTQADRSLERASGGLGIGLTLVKRLVEMHGGTVTAESPPRGDAPRRTGTSGGAGSEFTVRLPLTDPPAEPASPAAPAGEAPPTSRLRVLVADDNVDSADMLTMLLEELGNDVQAAHDGQEALSVAASFRPDVAILDIGMPKLNGYDVAQRVRAETWGAEVALIALTGWGQSEDRRRSREAGFDHHLVKPVSAAALEDMLAKVRS